MPSEEPAYPRLQLASDSSLLVTFGDGVSRTYHHKVFRLFTLLCAQRHATVQNLHPAYSSLLISFNPMLVHPFEFERDIRELLDHIDAAPPPQPRTVEIPVCYDVALGPDLGFVASYHGISIEEVVRIHSSPDYLVYFLGFSPGFPYLGDLPKQLETPRFPSPRVSVPAGSVAIGGSQTGVYPVTSPGGWRIIGRTPLPLFRADREPPTFLQMGNIVKFKPITREMFDELAETGM